MLAPFWSEEKINSWVLNWWPQLMCINSSPPSPAYMRQETGSALVQVMACRLTAPSHYLNQYWLIVNWTPRNKFQWYFNRHSIIFIEENAFENVVCYFPAKLSRGRWVNQSAHENISYMFLSVVPQFAINVLNLYFDKEFEFALDWSPLPPESLPSPVTSSLNVQCMKTWR